MAKTKGVVGTPINHIDATRGLEGTRSAGEPNRSAGGSTRGSTVTEQYRGGGINTKPNERGTPYHSQAGNPPNDGRVAEGTGRYGQVRSENNQDHANPASNGRGVMLDVGSLAGGSVPRPAPMIDSPAGGPKFEPGTIIAEDRAHLGTGNERAVDSLVEGGGVLSR
jgi:hypothetical protein